MIGRKTEFFQKLADTPIAGRSGAHCGIRDKVSRLNAGHRARVADYLNPTRIQIDLGRFGLIDIVSAVVHRIDESFPQCWQGIADPATDLAPASLLLKMRRRKALKVIQTAAGLIDKRPPEHALFLHISALIGVESYDFDSSALKPLHGLA